MRLRFFTCFNFVDDVVWQNGELLIKSSCILDNVCCRPLNNRAVFASGGRVQLLSSGRCDLCALVLVGVSDKTKC